MSPSLPHDSTVLLQDASNVPLKPGMIIQTKEPDVYIHRIVGVYPEVIITQGDNNHHPDQEINRTAVDKIVVGVLFT